MRIVVSNAAADELKEIKDYISRELKNPIAAQNTVSKIKAAYSKLRDNPYIGTPLNTKTERKSSLRYLVSGSYVIVYDVCDDIVKIMRIRNGRQSNWHFIFGDGLE